MDAILVKLSSSSNGTKKSKLLEEFVSSSPNRNQSASVSEHLLCHRFMESSNIDWNFESKFIVGSPSNCNHRSSARESDS